MASPRNIHVHNGYQQDSYTYYPVLIVGAGESGIAMGCRLKEKLGFDQFRIFDRQSGMGGTWWINRYPGVACDVPCPFYSFSFDPFYTATKLYPDGATVVNYLHRVAANYEIQDKVQLDTDVSEVVYDEDEELYTVTLSYMAPGKGDMGAKDRAKYVEKHGRDSVYLGQEKVKAKIVVSCVGGLVEPKAWPDSIPGPEDFNGSIIHTARWNENVSLDGKDVLVIGSGCTALQVVPTILKEPYKVKSVTQVMRTPPWCVPKEQEPFGQENYARWAPSIMHYAPVLGWISRMLSASIAEYTWHTIFQNTESNKRNRQVMEKKLLSRMRHIAPEKYHQMLAPDYGIGCKRRVFDTDWYRSMSNPKYRLTTQHLTKVTPDGVILGPGRAHPPETVDCPTASMSEEEIKADVIVLANGFDTAEFLHPLVVKGKGGKSMHDVWRARGGSQAYMGTAMDGFPNFFMIFGPNTVTGHTSVIMTSENMVNYTLNMIEPILKGDASTVEVKKEAEIEYAQRIQRELKDTVFHAGGCSSWYIDKNGWNPNTYPRSQVEFWFRCTFPKWNDWVYGYTTRGILKKRFFQTIKIATVLAAIIGTYLARKSGKSLIGIIKQRVFLALVQSLGALQFGAAKLQEAITS